AVGKWSIHATSKAAGGKFGRITQGESNWELMPLNQDSLFFNAEGGVKAGTTSRPIRKDSTWLIVRPDSCLPQRIPALAEVRRQVSDDYLTDYKSKLSDGALSRLKTKYGVKLTDRDAGVSDAELQKFHETHKSNYMSPETYEVWHVESKNRDQLVKRAAAVKDLEGFKALATQMNENPWTKPTQGLVGRIKKDFVLPYGIGMMPALFPVLDSLPSGLVKEPIQNPDTKKWHIFWLVSKESPQAKPFDRVRALVKQDIKSEAIKSIKPEDTLATYAKDKVIREKDVQFLREEIPPHLQERYTRESLVDFLLTWDLATMESDALGLTQDPKLRAQRLENKTNFWAQVYQDSIMSRNAGMDTNTLKKAFVENRAFLTRDSSESDWKRYVRDIAGILALDPKDLDIEYRTNPERYRRDTIPLSFEESRSEVYQNLKGLAYAKADERQLERLKKEFKVTILDPSLMVPKIQNPQETYKQAQNLHYDRKLDQALEMYGRLRDQFPKLESLQDSVCFGMAQIYIEQEKYQQALAEYRRVSYLFPQSPNNYKAMFMVGFIHAEHLKNDSAAVRSFEKMLAQYPSSDLSDDADWMIRNIRSGGKLMPVLEGDSTFVPQDTATKAGTPPAPAPEPKKAPTAPVDSAKPTSQSGAK
ncbi:MAG TPA: peptidyl-prolyl cis-trans isomerase, partial [Fibrobacteria bacterium]|nr:peptidyl-prolyl cis-trans isomerase [Fibrobacteria bacterium]